MPEEAASRRKNTPQTSHRLTVLSDNSSAPISTTPEEYELSGELPAVAFYLVSPLQKNQLKAFDINDFRLPPPGAIFLIDLINGMRGRCDAAKAEGTGSGVPVVDLYALCGEPQTG